MKKKEIIEKLAFVGVPSGSTLVEREIDNIVVSNVTESGGGKIIAARTIQKQLERAVEDYPDEASPELFAKLHEAASTFTGMALMAVLFDAVEDEILAEHRTRVQLLHSLADQCGFSYEDPEDPLLR